MVSSLVHDPARTRETLRAGFGRTLRGDEFARAHALAAAAPDPPPVPPADAPTPRQEPIAARLAAHGLPTRRTAQPRFTVVAVLGEGANGRIVCARDRDLGRDVAVKFLKLAPDADASAIDAFLDEARTTATLDHPNVPPVHDVDVNERGLPYFSMKRIAGRSLGDAIAASTAAARHPAIATANRVVSIAAAVAHALAYAHHRGVVHQDVKPDNVMLGEFGEVLLVDWGSAARLEDPTAKLYGTPLYMSPEQARSARSDARSDVYTLGATLFHALVLRVPTWADDPDEFWRRKRAGEIDAPTVEERRRAPAALIDIALKAMAPDPAARYQRVEDLADDLENYQAGLAVSAHREPWLSWLTRWHRRNARWLWAALVALAAITALAVGLYGERLKERASWGEPVVVERFARGWRDRWLVAAGAFADGEDGIVSQAGEGNALLLRRNLAGDVAVEFDGEVERGAFICDLSLLWDRVAEPEARVGHIETPEAGLLFAQVGAHGNAYSLLRGASGEQLAFSDFRLEAGRRYRIRLEIVGPSLALSVDGREICRYADAFPLTGGHVGIYTFSSGKRLREVRVYERSLPERVSVVAIPDELFREHRYDEAAALYERIARDHAGSAIAPEATYKRGLCALSADRGDDADAIWATLPRGPWRERSRWHALDRLIAAGDDAAIVAALADAGRSADAEVRDGVATRWAAVVARLIGRVRNGEVPTAALRPYLAALDGPLGALSITDQQAAFAFNLVGEAETTVARYPRQLPAVFEALALLGRSDEIIDRWPGTTDSIQAFADTGRWEELSRRHGDGAADAGMRAAQGRFADLMSWDGEYPRLVTGRLGEILALPGFDDMHARALLMLGRGDEVPPERRRDSLPYVLAVRGGAAALPRWGDHYRVGAAVRHLAGLEAFIAGDRQRAFELFAPLRGRVGAQAMYVFAHDVMAPFLHELAGERGALDRACVEIERSERWSYAQQPWYDARWLRGEIDDAEFLAQPHRGWAEARLALLRGVRADRAGARAEAVAAYRAYLALPPWRRADDIDPIESRFCAWRIAELTR